MGLREGGHVPRRFRDVPRFRTKYTSGELYKKLALIRSGQSTKASRDVRFRIRSLETYTDTPIRAWIVDISATNFLLFVWGFFLSYTILTSVISR